MSEEIYYTITGITGWLMAMLVAVFLLLMTTPASQPGVMQVRIHRGATIGQAASTLAKKGIVRFPALVSVPLYLQHGSVIAGVYRFDTSITPLGVIERLQSGDFNTQQKQLTVPEGWHRHQIARRVASTTTITKQAFLNASEGHEGYLFPDTYTIYSDITAEQLVQKMRDNFADQIKKLQPQLQTFPYSRAEIVTMASIVAREAAKYHIRRKVAGVLWKRLDAGMPLQADATFFYLTGQASHELTEQDLATSSPYNLYEHTGLPPTPIGNPGLGAIRATINPIKTNDLYYLTGDDGKFYFAETLEEHQQNKRKFIGE